MKFVVNGTSIITTKENKYENNRIRFKNRG